MKYNFDVIKDRRTVNSVKWSVGEGELPLWVADMDFDTAPEIKSRIVERAQFGIFGYAETTGEWEDAYIGWWERRYSFRIEREWIFFATGVVAAVSSAVRRFTTPNENVLILTPTYNVFYNSILNNGRIPLECELKFDGESYGIDFGDLEAKLKNPQTSLMILCNPQNPVGRVWKRDELSKIGELCAENGVLVFSDEIHCDITAPGTKYTPFAAASDICRKNCVVAVSPSKTFNLAGLSSAAVYAPDPFIRHRMWRQINTDECGEPNAFAVQAASAYQSGEAWLEELLRYIWKNRAATGKFLSENCPEICQIPANATYLSWLDVSGSGLDGKTFAERLRRETGLFVSAGSQYGKGGENFVRMNLATSEEILRDALGRLGKFCRSLR